MIAAPLAARAQIELGFTIFADVAPPPLPVYDQPPIPEEGYIWTPGYWAWDGDIDDYYWVPGTWVLPPEPGLYWTPGYWGWADGRYGFIGGYWGPTVGFYGGVDYGFGYSGDGYYGGEWRAGRFFYNRTVNNVVNVNITNVYERPVPPAASRASFNGPGGAQARPTPQQQAAARAPHVPPTANQVQHVNLAKAQPALRASANHGAPPIAATARPSAFKGPAVVPAARAGGPVRPTVAPAPAYQRPAPPAQGRPAARPAEPAYAQPARTPPPPQARPEMRMAPPPPPAPAARAAPPPRPEVRPAAPPPAERKPPPPERKPEDKRPE